MELVLTPTSHKSDVVDMSPITFATKVLRQYYTQNDARIVCDRTRLLVAFPTARYIFEALVGFGEVYYRYRQTRTGLSWTDIITTLEKP